MRKPYGDCINDSIKQSYIETDRNSKFSIPQKWLHELEQVYKQSLDIEPTLMTISCQHFRHETPVAHQLEPCKADEAFQSE